MLRVFSLNRVLSRVAPPLIIPRANVSKLPQDHDETDKEFDDRMECFFNRPEIDGWEIRKALNDLAGMDAVPEPRILIAALCACRRLNDYALTTRLLEMVKCKCGPYHKTIYPWILQEIEPVLEELGICTPEQMGYHRPELWLPDAQDTVIPAKRQDQCDCDADDDDK